MPHRSLIPLSLSMLAVGSALAIMLFRNGAEIFGEWYFYTSVVSLVMMGASLFASPLGAAGNLLWRILQAWSGLWALVVLLAFVYPPISILIIAKATAPMLESSGVHPVFAAFVHVFVWACASAICASYKKARLAHQLT